MSEKTAVMKNGDPHLIDIECHLDDFKLQVNLSLPKHGIVAVLGESGSGKTTLIRSVAGLQACRGTLVINQHTWQNLDSVVPTEKRSLSLVFQDDNLLTHLTVEKNLQFALERASQPMNKEQINELIALLGIEHTLNKRPENLSGGEKQRVAIARAFLVNADLMLLDEPLSALDAERKRKVLSYFIQHKRCNQGLILYITHSMEEAARIADYIVILKKGLVSFEGKIAQAFNQLNPLKIVEQSELSLVFGQTTLHDKEKKLTQVQVGEETLYLPLQICTDLGEVRLAIKPADISLTKSKASDSSILNIVPCTITSLAPAETSGLSMVAVDFSGQTLMAKISEYSVRRLNFAIGDKVYAQIKSASILS